MVSIGQMNKRVYLIQLQNQMPDGYGGLTQPTAALKRSFWASVKQGGSGRTEDAEQQVLTRTYEFVTKYRQDIKVSNGNYLIYDGKILQLQQAVDLDTVKKQIKITATQRDNGSGELATLPGIDAEVLGPIRILVYYAEGGETSFTKEQLIDKEILIVFEDGTGLEVVTGEPDNQQAAFIAEQGVLEFNHQLQTGSIIQVLYQ